jgi:hypothetical protein
MSLATYGVLKCWALERQINPATDSSPHYQVFGKRWASKTPHRHQRQIPRKPFGFAVPSQ